MAHIIFVTILFIVFCVLLNCSMLKADNATKFNYYFVGCITTCCVLLLIFTYALKFNPTPTALDVYQGKTTLEYTIRDGEKIDSVVVFKK